MTTLTAFEHEWLLIGEGPLARLTEDQARALERLATSLPAGTLEWRRREVKFAQFCGVVQVGALTLEILPKLAREHEDAVRSRTLLVRMLRLAGIFKATPVGQASLGVQSTHLLDWFIDQFRAEVQQQLRQGMIRRYVQHEESLSCVRGRIDIPRQLTENLTRPHLMACRYETLEHDNLYNQALVYVLRMLCQRAHRSRVRHDLEELILHFGYVTHREFFADDVDSFVFQRMEDRWQPVFDQAALFLRCLYPDIHSGDQPALALLFDMNVLFEQYVASRMRRDMPGWRVMTQGPLRHVAVDGGQRNVFPLRPDIVLFQDAIPLFVADTKWKLLKPDRRQIGIDRSDIHQMIVYAERYQCREVALVYPMIGGGNGLEILQSFSVIESDLVVRVYGADLFNESGKFSITSPIQI